MVFLPLMKPSLVIIGLGNPGKEYEGTRHNVGYQAANVLQEAFGTSVWSDKQKFLGHFAEGRIVTVPILLIKPTTFMNRTGECAAKVIDFFKLDPSKELLVLSDDVDFDVGDLRLRTSGGPGTHNGLKSIVEQFGEDFPRLRIGIGAQHEGEDLSSYVLSKPSADDAAKIAEAVSGVSKVVEEFVMGEK